MTKDYIRDRIAELMAVKDEKVIAKGDEVLKYLTAVMRGEYANGEKVTDDVVMPVGCGDGCSSLEHDEVRVGTRERTKAAELLGRRHGLFTDKVTLGGVASVVIVDDVPPAPVEGSG